MDTINYKDFPPGRKRRLIYGEMIRGRHDKQMIYNMFIRFTLELYCTDNLFCSICLQNVESGARVCKLVCNHKYHKTCIFKWFSQCMTSNISVHCPMCRQNLY